MDPEKINTELPLGLVDLPERTFDYDLQVCDRYQTFSAELLRLSLLGIAAVGYIVANILLAKDPPKSPGEGFQWAASISLVLLGLSASLALLHRYLSSDSMAYHLEATRLDRRNRKEDSPFTTAKYAKRDELFKWAEVALYFSGALLALGALSLATAFVFVCFAL